MNTVSKEPNTETNLELWQYRFGYLGMDNVKTLQHDNLVDGEQIHLQNAELCGLCIPKGTAKRLLEDQVILLVLLMIFLDLLKCTSLCRRVKSW